MQCHIEFSDDPKVAASSTDGPVKVWVLLWACLDLSSVGQHQFCGKNVVAAEAVLAHERTDAPTEKKSSYAHGRTLTQHGGHSCLGGLDLNRAAQHSTADSSMTFVPSNGNVAEAGHVEHEASLASGVSGIAVAPAADGERQMIGACEAQGDLDVLWVHWMYYEVGMCVKLGCIAFAKLLVLRVAGAKDGSRESSRKGREMGLARLRERKRRELLRKAGPRKKRKGRTKTLPEERTPIHRCPCERWILSQVPGE